MIDCRVPSSIAVLPPTMARHRADELCVPQEEMAEAAHLIDALIENAVKNASEKVVHEKEDAPIGDDVVTMEKTSARSNSSTASLTQTMLTMHMKPHCGGYLETVTKHADVERSTRADMPFKCAECAYTAASAVMLTMHRRAHLNMLSLEEDESTRGMTVEQYDGEMGHEEDDETESFELVNESSCNTSRTASDDDVHGASIYWFIHIDWLQTSPSR